MAKAVRVNSGWEPGAAIFLPNAAVRTDSELWKHLQELVAVEEKKRRIEDYNHE